jgi:hypothetical protein
MPTYFHGWRRKLGVVTLVMACVLIAAWVRSLSMNDNLVLARDRHRAYCLISLNGEIAIWITTSVTPATSTSLLPRWLGGPIQGESWEAHHLGYLFKRNGFGSGIATLDSLGSTALFWLIPYWSVVIPLTLFSASLLLSKQQTIKSEQEISGPR